MLKQERVRPYKVRYRLGTCPFPTVMYVTWLVIEEATLQDAAAKYECYGNYIVTNPVMTTLSEEKALSLNPGTRMMFIK